MTSQLSVDGVSSEKMLANVQRPVGFPNASGAPNRDHGFVLNEHGKWVDVLGSVGKHTLAVDVFIDPTAPVGNTLPVGQSPFCFENGKLVDC